ncbi:hypothetical protein B484DRAFT_403434, partial [Ochromonadaceae sp. CCMP2298]
MFFGAFLLLTLIIESIMSKSVVVRFISDHYGMEDDSGDANECEDEPYAVPGLYCTMCEHDLNRAAYLVCTHPDLPVPLCIECLDELRKKEEVDNMEAELQSIQDDDEWRCFHCRPSQLKHFKEALRIGQKQSLYSRVVYEGDTEEQLKSRLVLLEAILDGSKEAGEVLQDDFLQDKEREFREELAAQSSDPSE